MPNESVKKRFIMRNERTQGKGVYELFSCVNLEDAAKLSKKEFRIIIF